MFMALTYFLGLRDGEGVCMNLLFSASSDPLDFKHCVILTETDNSHVAK